VVSAFGFECRLGEAAPRADLGIRFARPVAGADVEGSLASVARSLSSSEVWRRLGAFCARWSDPRDLLHRGIEDVLLEFDLPGPPPEVPIPSFFLEIEKTATASLMHDASLAALAILQGESATTRFHEGFGRAVAALPPGARITAVGSMLSRTVRSVRVCVTGLPAPAVPAYVEAIGWPGNRGELDALVASVAACVDRVEPCFDLGDAVGEKLGVELHIDGPRAERRTRWARVLEMLVARGECLPDKRDALQRWVGSARLEGRAPEEAPCLILREINHVKLVRARDRRPEAKGYVSFQRRSIRGA
jgi:hypothetical protein